jgi:hypothetical protein
MSERKAMKTEKLYKLYQYAFGQGLVKNKKEFADLIGVTRPTLSYALSGTGTVNVGNILERAEDALQARGVDLNAIGDGNLQVAGNNNELGLPTKKFEHEDGWFEIIAAKDRQIEVLLSQQTEFLRLSSSLTAQNQMLIEKLTK